MSSQELMMSSSGLRGGLRSEDSEVRLRVKPGGGVGGTMVPAGEARSEEGGGGGSRVKRP